MPRLRPIVLLLTLLLGAVPALAQDTETAPPPRGPTPAPEFDSPRSTLRTFITAMSQVPPDRNAGAQCIDTSSMLPGVAPNLAWKLYRCINRIEQVNFNDPTIPDAEDVRDSDGSSWQFFPREKPRFGRSLDRFERVQELAPDALIVMVRMPGGEWKFSSATALGAEALWSAIGSMPPVVDEPYVTASDRIEEWWTSLGGLTVQREFLQVEYWQWGTLFLVILFGVIVDFSVRFIAVLLSRRYVVRQGGTTKPGTIRRTVRPFGLAAAAVFWLLVIPWLDLPVAALSVLMPAARFFAMLAGVWAAFRVTDLVSEVFISKAERTDTKLDDALIPLVRRTVKVFIFVFGLIYVAQGMNISIAPLLAGLGIGGAGFAFAAKDTLENLFGSITVLADRPFQVGDWVTVGDTEGIVEEVGFRSTRIRTFYNSLVTVPNGNLVRAVVDNYGRRKYRRWTTHIGVVYGTTPDQIEAFCEGIRELIRLHPYTRKDYFLVWLHKFGAHSLDILIYAFFEAPDWQTELRERHRLMLDIMRLAGKLQVEFAFPTQTLQMAQVELPQPPPEAPPGMSADRQAHREGRTAVAALTKDADWRAGKPAPFRIRSTSQLEPDDEDDETQIESKVGGDAG